jgi:NitT/TauT family transport system permease protein
MNNILQRYSTALWSLLVLVVFLLTWEYGPGLIGVPEFVLPPLSRVWNEAVRIWSGERLLWHAGITAVEVIIGFILGSILGALIGYALGLSPKVEAVLSPYLLALQIAPKVAFAPLFVMWLGYTMYPKILVAVLIVFFPVLINVLSAMRNMDHDMINLARSFSATRLQVFRTVEYPTTLPALFSGRACQHAGSHRCGGGATWWRMGLAICWCFEGQQYGWRVCGDRCAHRHRHRGLLRCGAGRAQSAALPA